MMAGTCKGCDAPLAPNKAQGRRRIWCSDRCRKRTLYSKQCIDCGTTINTDGRIKRASTRCLPCANGSDERRQAMHEALTGRNDWPDDEILRAIRACAVDGHVTTHMYQERTWGPTIPTIFQRFGSWNAAVEAAGLSHGQATRTYTRTSRDECIAAVARCIRDLGRERPTVYQYDAWSRGRGVPCHTIVRRRCGTWTDALGMALDLIGAPA